MMVEFHLCWLLIRSRELNIRHLFLESMLYISNGSRTGDSLIHEHVFSELHLTEKKGMQVHMFTSRPPCRMQLGNTKPYQLCWDDQDAIDLIHAWRTSCVPRPSSKEEGLGTRVKGGLGSEFQQNVTATTFAMKLEKFWKASDHI